MRQGFPDVPVFHHSSPTGEQVVDLAERGEFEHLNLKRRLCRDRPDWRLGPIIRDRLWTVTLHYHAWAFVLAEAAGENVPYSARAAELFRHYVSDWITSCDIGRPGADKLAWNAFAVATRTSWWQGSYLALGRQKFGAWDDLEGSFLASLWQQAAYLHDHIEWDLRANHLVCDAASARLGGQVL